MKNMNIVITMAGMGSRFRKAGYTVPKYMVQAKGRTLFEWSLLSLYGFKDAASRYIFIVRKDEDEDAAQFIREKCRMTGLTDYQIMVIDDLTDGQASTAMLASAYWKAKEPLLIYNIDTYVEAGEMNASQLRGDGFLPCFQSAGEHWSFVQADETGRVTEVREKERISDFCTLGAYYFRSCGLYEQLYQEYYSDRENMVKGEKYVAPLYNLMIRKGYEVFMVNVNPDKVHVLGTPEEVENFVQEL